MNAVLPLIAIPEFRLALCIQPRGDADGTERGNGDDLKSSMFSDLPEQAFRHWMERIFVVWPPIPTAPRTTPPWADQINRHQTKTRPRRPKPPPSKLRRV